MCYSVDNERDTRAESIKAGLDDAEDRDKALEYYALHETDYQRSPAVAEGIKFLRRCGRQAYSRVYDDVKKLWRVFLKLVE